MGKGKKKPRKKGRKGKKKKGSVLATVSKSLGKVIKQKKRKNLAVFVDGPNILRKELGIDMRDIKKALDKYGNLKIAKVFLDQFATNKLVEAVANQGFESVLTVGDVDVAMAVAATEAAFNKSIHAVAFVTRDSDFLPAVITAKRSGKETIVLMTREGSAAALKNTADVVMVLGA